MDGVGMNERDLKPEEAPARLLVDQLRPLAGELAERRPDVVDLVGDVVHPGAPPREEAADGRVLGERREELDTAGAEQHGHGLNPLLGERVAMLERRPEELRVRGQGLLEVVHGHAEMMDAAGDHCPRS